MKFIKNEIWSFNKKIYLIVTFCSMALQGDVVVTGGAGYVGSHVLVELLEGGFDDVIVIDRLNEAKRGKNP